MIDLDVFKKLDLRIGEIKSAEKIDDDFFRLKLDCDGIITTLLQGDFSAKELVGMKVVVLVNFKPVEIRGEKSEGMLLAADESGKPILLVPEKSVKTGTKIR